MTKDKFKNLKYRINSASFAIYRLGLVTDYAKLRFTKLRELLNELNGVSH